MARKQRKDTVETDTFELHPNMWYDVVFRQAGTLSKAILEGVMNAADAGAESCRIAIQPDYVLIIDDGKGFESKAEIKKVWKWFGQPHTDEEKKTFGTFRIGRGQMFAFGKNRWKTNLWHLVTDAKNRGREYDLITTGNKTNGCSIRIDLYAKLMPSQVAEIERDMLNWCKWVDIEVTVNDVLVSRKPAKAKWDHTLEEAYIKLNSTGMLVIYNLGIRVLEFPSYKFGCGGEIVSRKQLKVNFARNDIQSDCEVWKKIKPFVDKQATTKNVKKKALDDAGRQRLADQLSMGDMDGLGAADLKLFTAVTGRHYSARQLFNTNLAVTSAAAGSRVGDTLMKQGLAFVLADVTLERFGKKSAEGLITWTKQKFFADERWMKAPKTVPLEKVSAGLSDSHILLDDIKPNEKVWLDIAQHSAHNLKVDDEYIFAHYGEHRKLKIGTSATAGGWTDGRSYVAIGREFLARQKFDVIGFVNLGNLVIHEACHDKADWEAHGHTQEFYEKFHDTVEKCLGIFVSECLAALPQAMARQQRKIGKATAKALDKVARAENLEAVAASFNEASG